MLGFANPKLPYVLHTDASLHGLGAALYQEQEGHLRFIAFASRGLSNCEKRYPTHKLEFLALKWAITDKFYDYLYGAEFVVMTDNNPLTYILTSAKLDAAGHRWLASLSNFNFAFSTERERKIKMPMVCPGDHTLSPTSISVLKLRTIVFINSFLSS